MATTTAKTRKLIYLAILVAIMLILAFTPLGFLKVGLIEITFMTIPVVVGAVILGPKGGFILGTVFGLTSFIQCFGMSAFGSALLNIQPIYTFILCMVPRMLMGWLAGVAFKALYKPENTATIAPMGVAALVASVLNTILFAGGLILFFGRSDYILEMRDGRGLLLFFTSFIGVNGIVEAIVVVIVSSAICKALLRFLPQEA